MKIGEGEAFFRYILLFLLSKGALNHKTRSDMNELLLLHHISIGKHGYRIKIK
jgi:hypothetical protein